MWPEHQFNLFDLAYESMCTLCSGGCKGATDLPGHGSSSNVRIRRRYGAVLQPSRANEVCTFAILEPGTVCHSCNVYSWYAVTASETSALLRIYTPDGQQCREGRLST
eukprot:SAG31_NODE_12714_length_922_cov_0.800729_1_plen_107_part_10